ncbi:MAG: 30S ribosomal protein S16 [Candidatus Phytoplasma stylosanthis]|uniref:30S ribosomal protein S16 n=1 Tax=Candidatus Phytoplasma stylosanthis TaxID=2798314 RepID=UPI00293B7C09|nr:30S ribosomal protein S16 [Candidatus Phytoplasma stylosanthis]MDV3168148.1 30S ribosomal protein S16 [Candidatus Phytoplasma stylosanthis]MDV3170712.1 30S ribosomal protein S16 [Candidatus Phytoplasma stylosanthis]MDV3173839.1 30S ribosomal protein S16 [Candidatus Phytoplasma stylosanthis]MDV3173969.1 30S ribosomal protein S16 [Candidatus Phytoplasma stylosanthis]MDV3202657.1 30S ribosomal protein S16 [Candidatus Phytoplasma stylosanthis]
MSIRMRLQRFGNHKRPFYRIVAADSRSKRDGKFLEILGTYEPFSNLINIKLEKIEKWFSAGIQPTKTVKSLLKKHKNKSKLV